MAWFRSVALLLALTLPLHGAAAARMLFCGLATGTEVTTTVAASADGHHHLHDSNGTSTSAVDHHAGHDAEPRAGGRSSPHGECGFCAICLHATAVAPADVFTWTAPPSAADPARAPSVFRPQFLTGAPDRPPSPDPIA